MKIEVERGVPVPDKKASTGRPPIYPFREMKKGDSFFVPSQKRAASLRCLARVRGKELGRKFSVRLHEGGVRVWRVK